MTTQLDRRIDRVALLVLALLVTALLATGVSVHIRQKNTAYLVVDGLVWLLLMGVLAVKYRRLGRKR